MTSIVGSSTLPPSPSSTFSDFDDPIPTFTRGPGRNGGGRNGDNNGPSGNQGGGTSASVYLYTFLGVLLLLLAISAAIVTRAIIRRRRQRRMMEEAIRNGTWVSPNGKPSKPVLYETAMNNVGNEHHDWEACKPFAVSYIQEVPPPTPPQQEVSLRARILALIKGSPPADSRVTRTVSTAGPLHVSMLIAMPSPKSGEKEGQIPHIELGTAEVLVVHPSDNPNPLTPSNARRKAVEEKV
ncbi:uncharacterized protein EV420DRAFT_1646268 [Desarmillaria tabescens]|uniref:Uncharacterized protein n=1 Tax=Armillaria tabescens TaxID=1929756 RepID=A0AA39K123_ARMTA|nr:uncharacterized protein EV420DRAFT_1646268 [Desarmillaria tabescens]KAK0451194.1 hypothetical protein EV420DRAFT_1646268 [Desarmillaria tabescens]